MRKTGAVLAGLVTAAILLVAGPGRTGDKDSRWKKFLPADAYKELVEREVKILKASLQGKVEEEAINRAKLAAVMIAALALSAEKDVKQSAVVEHAALQLAKLLQEKDKIPQAQKIADALAAMKLVSPAGGLQAVNMKKIFGGEVLAMMDHLRTKMKGGDGIHEALQTNIRLKGALNGIEEKIRSLESKKLGNAAMSKSAAEMVLLGYRTAVLAEITYDFAPAKEEGKKTPKLWRNFSVQMRDASLDMAAAAKKNDADAVHRAATRLYATCNNCHSVFK